MESGARDSATSVGTGEGGGGGSGYEQETWVFAVYGILAGISFTELLFQVKSKRYTYNMLHR